MIGLPDIFWIVVLGLVVFGIWLGSLLYMLYDRVWMATGSFLYGIGFVWMILNVSMLNQERLIEVVFAAASLVYFVSFPRRRFDVLSKGFQNKIQAAGLAKKTDDTD